MGAPDDTGSVRVTLSTCGLRGLPLAVAEARLRYAAEYRCVIDGRKTIIMRD